MPRNQLVTDIRAALDSEQDAAETSGSYGAVSVGTTPVAVIGPTPGRASVLIQNVSSATRAYVGFDDTVTANTGVLVAPGGGAYSDDAYTGAVYVVAESANTDIRFQEITR